MFLNIFVALTDQRLTVCWTQMLSFLEDYLFSVVLKVAPSDFAVRIPGSSLNTNQNAWKIIQKNNSHMFARNRSQFQWRSGREIYQNGSYRGKLSREGYEYNLHDQKRAWKELLYSPIFLHKWALGPVIAFVFTADCHCSLHYTDLHIYIIRRVIRRTETYCALLFTLLWKSWTIDICMGRNQRQINNSLGRVIWKETFTDIISMFDLLEIST